MKSIADIVSEYPVFKDLDQDITDLIAGCGQNVIFEAGDYLFREGDSAERFFLLREGSVAQEMFVPGRGTVIYSTLQPGDIVGTAWLVPPYRWTYDARAVSQVRTVSFDAKCMRDKSEADNRVGYAMMKRFVPTLVEQLRVARLQSLDVYGRPGRTAA